MAAYAQFGYGGYPSASQMLAAGQSPQTGDTPSAQSTISSANAPPLSPTSTECRSNTAAVASAAGEASSGALSPDALSSQASNPAIANAAVTGALPLGSASSMDASALGHGPSVNVASGTGGGSCCENGRPIMTDPVSGQTVCSCQYDSARLALSSYSRLPAASVGVYGTPYPSTDQNPYQSIGVDSSAFYSPLNNPYSLKDSTTGTEMSAWASASLQPTTGYYSYDPMSAYGYGASYDLAARRKNATRESTATLKAWLNEHKKNPYPTKGEKIMLAIITKMTLTQVSTWFANARRRLKKENKMTWEPKNRTEDDDDAMLSDDEKDKDDNKSLHGAIDQRKEQDKTEEDLLEDEHLQKSSLNHPHDMRSGLGFPNATGYETASHSHAYHPYQQHPYYQHQQAMLAASYNNKTDSSDPKNTLGRDCGVPIPATKPKIWSLADTVACKTPPPTATYMGQQQQHHHQQQQQQPQQQYTMQPSQPMGRNQVYMQQQMPAQHMMSNYGATPYSRVPTTAYGGFLGPATTQQQHTTSNTPYNHPMSNDRQHPTTIPTSSNNALNIQHQPQRAMGFPEAQPDTPPQTPPNMKMASVAANLLLNASQVPTIATCRNINPYGSQNGYGNYSPRDDCSSASSCSSASPVNEAEFKAMYKSQSLNNMSGYVPPV